MTANPSRPRVAHPWIALALLTTAPGCGREFFREWVNQDVTEAVFEKSRDPRFRIDMFSIEPPAGSRFANPFDPDYPPAPPDDRAAEALSPVPQRPEFRLLTPQEGTGYLGMLESWTQDYKQREAIREAQEEAGEAPTEPEEDAPDTDPDLADKPAPNPPPEANPAPANPNEPAAEPGRKDPAEQGAPAGPGAPEEAPDPPDPGSAIPGPTTRLLTPKELEALNAATVAPSNLPPGRRFEPDVIASASRASQVPPSQRLRVVPQVAGRGPRKAGHLLHDYGKNEPRKTARAQSPAAKGAEGPVVASKGAKKPAKPERDPAMLLAARFQPAAGAQGEQAAPSAGTPSESPMPVVAPEPPADPGADGPPIRVPSTPPVGDDPEAGKPNLPPALETERDIETPEGDEAMAVPRVEGEPAGTGTGSVFQKTVVAESDILGLPKDAKPYIIGLEQAVNLSLVNSRSYQTALEDVYLDALPVTLARFNFQPQFFAQMGGGGVSPAAGGAPVNPTNSFFYATQETGNPASTLNLGGTVGVGKVFSSGARVLAAFASQIVFNFNGPNPRQPTIQSTLPISAVLPLLRGGGRAFVLENLTQNERNLLYSVRDFARFRQNFLTAVVTGSGTLQGNIDPTIGYLPILQQYVAVENTFRNVQLLTRFLRQFEELAKGEPSGLSEQQVNLIRSQLESTKSTLVANATAFRNALDQYKIQLGMPPDVPLLLDRAPIQGFRDVFGEIEEWSLQENRDLGQLGGFIERLPGLQEITIDGRPILAYVDDADRNEDLLIAGARVALENRLDLMNTRAQLYDSWRQLAVTANQLKGVANISLTNQVLTTPGTQNAFALDSQAKQFSLVVNLEAPLIRVAERNAFQTARINYQRAQRTLMSAEDQLKYQIRQYIRLLQQFQQQYKLQKLVLDITIRNIDNAYEQINAPPTGSGDGGGGGGSQQLAQTQTLLSSTQQLLSNQNTLIGIWVQYQTVRLNLYRDLGTMPYDEWEAFYELFPPERAGGDARPRGGRPAEPGVGPPGETAGRRAGGGQGGGAPRARTVAAPRAAGRA